MADRARGAHTQNFNLYKQLTLKREKQVLTFTGFEEGKPMSYRCKVKTEEMAQELKEAVEKGVKEL